jgi:hypothetical protein
MAVATELSRQLVASVRPHRCVDKLVCPVKMAERGGSRIIYAPSVQWKMMRATSVGHHRA